jgi:hypothetical protein
VYAIVGEIPILEDLCVSAWTIWKVPAMYFLAMVVDELDCPRAGEVGEKSIARRDFVRIYSTKSKPSARQSTLLHCFPVSFGLVNRRRRSGNEVQIVRDVSKHRRYTGRAYFLILSIEA